MKICPRCHTKYEDSNNVCTHDGVRLEVVEAPKTEKFDEMIGSVLEGRFKILSKLGQGGMGAVYKAEQLSMGRICAIKVIPEDMAQSGDAIERFNREAKMAALINDAHAVTVYDFGETSKGMYFLAMEYVEGETLSGLLKREGVQPLPRVLNIIKQCGQALSAAHNKNIVHRDLKPDNIMISKKDGQDWIKILDFGIAKRSVDGGIGEELTKSGMVIGTPLYMSPEQLSGEKLDARSDIYSFAIIVYQMLVGGFPFQGDSAQALMVKRLTEDPLPASVVNPRVSIPPSVDMVLLGALAREKTKRTPTMQQFVEQLEQATRTTTGFKGATNPIPPGGQMFPPGQSGPQYPAQPSGPGYRPTVPGGPPSTNYNMPPTVPPSGNMPGYNMPTPSTPGRGFTPPPTPARPMQPPMPMGGPSGNNPASGNFSGPTTPPTIPGPPPNNMGPQNQNMGPQNMGRPNQMPMPNPPGGFMPGPNNQMGPGNQQMMGGPMPTPPQPQPPIGAKKSRRGFWIFTIIFILSITMVACGVFIYAINHIDKNSGSSHSGGSNGSDPSNNNGSSNNSDGSEKIDENSQNIDERYQSGVADLGAGKYKEATRKFQAVVDDDPKNGKALENLAVSLYRQGQYQQSIDAGEQAVKLLQDNPAKQAEAYEILGRANYNLHHYAEAAKIFQSGYDLNRNSESLMFTGFAYQLSGDRTKANETYNQFLSTFASNENAPQIESVRDSKAYPPPELPTN